MNSEEKQNRKLKVTCVADHFMTEDFYRAALKDFKDFALTGISYFGAHTREEMRAMVDRIEKVGAESYAPPQELYAHIKEADVLIVHLCPVSRKLMEAAPNLKYILSNRGGLENIDVEAAKELGIHVINNPAHNSNAVAELAICLMICETRNVARANKGLKDGIWREDYPNYGRVFELRGQTVGLIGFGNIGRLVAEKLMPFGTKVITADPAITPEDTKPRTRAVAIFPIPINPSFIASPSLHVDIFHYTPWHPACQAKKPIPQGNGLFLFCLWQAVCNIGLHSVLGKPQHVGTLAVKQVLGKPTVFHIGHGKVLARGRKLLLAAANGLDDADIPLRA